MIVIPMAGLSQRFINAGYKLPKYMLPLGKYTVFNYVLSSFKNYYDTHPFLFICRDIHETKSFVARECTKLGINNWRIVMLGVPTKGQAETVSLGLTEIGYDLTSSITIFNIDTIRPNFSFPSLDIMEKADGFLEVFRGKGDGWSFAKTISIDSMEVVETAEKKRISDLCSTGLYYFRCAGDFVQALHLDRQYLGSGRDQKELYIAPLYNYLIKDHKKVFAIEVSVEELIPCGTPEEYEKLKESALTIL